VSDERERAEGQSAHKSSKVERPGRKLLAANETRDDGDRIRDVLANDAHREERADGRVTGKGEQADERSEEARNPNAIDGRREFAVEAVDVAREGEGAVAREGEVLARGNGQLEILVSMVSYSRRREDAYDACSDEESGRP
jgi:hypothetical protein